MACAGKILSRCLRSTLTYKFKNFRVSSIYSYSYYTSLYTESKFRKLKTTSSLSLRKISQGTEMAALSPLDPSSFSHPDLASLKHASLRLNIDFDKKTLSGSVLLDFTVKSKIDNVILDVSDLELESVGLPNGTQLSYSLGDPIPNFGSKLTISLPKTVNPDEELKIKIVYKTSPTASALQWLEPNQTSGKQHPYLFSQCQPIHARSILPCQDTPAVKFTYDAEVTAPAGFTVLMSALRTEGGSATSFRQPVPIPSYLLAIAAGRLEARSLGPRSLVWSEKEEIERSAWEFAETERYLAAAERLVGPYVWGQYDLLVLPPSFPYGGMENPCLTFVTPCLLAGDRSQADVIVHEIMHSWTGNLVTNRNFEHFWLNEGFTVYLERKVAASLIEDKVTAAKSRDFHSLLGLNELKETVEVLKDSSALTRLVPDLTGVHPDDSFSRVPYEKGSLFLRYLEDLTGGPAVFDEFLRSYLDHFKRQSLDTEQFKQYLLDYFKSRPAQAQALSQVDWETWLHGAGMPPVIPAYDTSMTKVVNEVLSQMAEEPLPAVVFEKASAFTPHQLLLFLQELLDLPPLSVEKLNQLGDKLKLNVSKNSEIQYRWARLCIRSKDTTKLPQVLEFLNSQGRMKYARPIYRDLYAWTEVRDQTIENFLKNEPFMMHVSAYTLRKDLHLRSEVMQTSS